MVVVRTAELRARWDRQQARYQAGLPLEARLRRARFRLVAGLGEQWNETERHANGCAVPVSGVTLSSFQVCRRRFHPGKKHCAGPRSCRRWKVDVRSEQWAVPTSREGEAVVRGLPV